MNADGMFVIGSTHAVCQDYVSANAELPYVILSDGCSSSPDTDVGARLLVKATEKTFRSSLDVTQLHCAAAQVALDWSNNLGLAVNAVDATLLTAQVRDQNVIVGCSGDGVILFQSIDDSLEVYSISYPSGYPVYPAYQHQSDRLDSLRLNGHLAKEVKHFSCRAGYDSICLTNTFNSESFTEVLTCEQNNLKCVAIVSDGLHSFFRTRETATSKRIETVQMMDVVNELLNFKSLGGAFMTRRVKRFLKECRGRGWEHSDDLAIGVIHFGA